MSALIKSAARSYAVWGVSLLCLGLALLTIRHRELVESWPINWFLWQVLTGLILMGLLIYQWALLTARLVGTSQSSRKHYNWHRYVGVGMTALFILHAVRFGYYWTSALAIIFLLNGFVGLLNKEVVTYKSRGLYLIWYGLHVSLSAVLMPLTALHIWVALVFE
ncbi:MAG: hypothetical protein O3A08_10170 [Proteobacteria bacterium]|jgi:hypothetical protein|nr:hypothetical protein [Pseudomonadota bacterium]